MVKPDASPLLLAALGLALCLAVAGCGGGGPAPLADPNVAVEPGPHGVPALPLGDRGFAEVVVEPAKPAKKGKPQSLLAVYLLAADRTAPLPAEPTEVKANVSHPENPAPTAVALEPKPDPSAPDARRYASEPGRFDYDELTGVLTVVLDGET